MSENLIDIKQTAEYLQMNKMTVYKLAREGKIPAFKVASEWRFRKDLIDAWLMNQIKDRPDFEQITTTQQSKTGGRILIVDDDQAIQDYFERTLKDYTIEKASSGEEALAVIRNNKPELVLLDIRMPGIDGIETLRRIKEIDSSISVIMLSAYGTLQTNLEAVRLGAITSMAKPFDLGEIKAIITDAFTNPSPGRPIS